MPEILEHLENYKEFLLDELHDLRAMGSYEGCIATLNQIRKLNSTLRKLKGMPNAKIQNEA